MDWQQDIKQLERILSIIKINNLGINYSKMYRELIAIKPGMHELMIHSNYFDKYPDGCTLRDRVFRMLRGIDDAFDIDMPLLPQDIELGSYYRYAPCHVTEGPFAKRKQLSVSFFEEIRKIQNSDKISTLSDKITTYDYYHKTVKTNEDLYRLLADTACYNKYDN